MKAAVATPSAREFEQEPLLNRLILHCHSPRLRRELSQGAISYRRDCAQIGVHTQTCETADLHLRAQAGIRVVRVRSLLSREDYAFLNEMILNTASKPELSRAFALRSAATETKGLSVLREIAQVYT